MRSFKSLRVQLNAKTTFSLNTTCNLNTLLPLNKSAKSLSNLESNQTKRSTSSISQLINHPNRKINQFKKDHQFSRTMSSTNTNQHTLTTG